MSTDARETFAPPAVSGDLLNPAAMAALERLQPMHQGLDEGRVPAWIFNDAGLYELERSRLFSRCWNFLAHESEIPSSGDYVVRYITDNSIIVARDDQGQVHAHLNVCRHRGNQVCKSELGNASFFRCSYHGWTFKNSGELIGVPYYDEAYDRKLDRSQWGLVPVRVETYKGLIFGTFDHEAVSLEEYLGGFEWYLDQYLGGEAGTEVYGPPNRWDSATDWKICAENFGGDGYHTPITHQFGFSLGYFPSTGAMHFKGWAAHIPNKGHCMGLGVTEGLPPFVGYTDDLVEAMKKSLSPEQFEIFRQVRTAVGTVFPNLSFIGQPLSRIPGDPGVRLCGMRLWHPIGAGRIRTWSWCLVPKDATDEYKERAYQAYLMGFTPAGTFEQDDFENWTNLTRQAGSSVVRGLDLPYDMGLGKEPETDFPGPGVVVTPYITETGFRNMWKTWLQWLDPDGADGQSNGQKQATS